MHAAVRSVVEAASDGPDDFCVLDTAASSEQLTRGTVRHADTLWAVVEPYPRSLETGRRIARLAGELGMQRVELIANKVRGDADVAYVGEFLDLHDLSLAGVVPHDSAFPDAERRGVAPLDLAPSGPAVRAIGELALRLTAARG